MEDLKKKYKTVMADHFPEVMSISFGDQTLEYRKKTWKIPDASGELIEKGLRYGENPGQEAALYELSNGNLTLGGCAFISPGRGLVIERDDGEGSAAAFKAVYDVDLSGEPVHKSLLLDLLHVPDPRGVSLPALESLGLARV